MNLEAHEDDRRFVDGGDGSALDARIAQSLRYTSELAGLPEARIQAIGRSLAAERPPARRHRWHYAIAVAALLACGTAAAVIRFQKGDRRRASPSYEPAVTERAAPAEPGRHAVLPPANASPAVGNTQTPVPHGPAHPTPAGTSREAPARRTSPVAQPIASSSNTPDAVESSALGEEARLLRRAIESLRTEGNPRKTLALLDEHRSTFPDGRLRANADLLRVDAWLALGDRTEAKALLEHLPFESGPRGDELLVLRGELRADADCGQALQDFDRALSRPLADKLAERALRGRAICRLRRGDRSAAKDDLRTYVQRFPNGRFTARAREELEGR
jgi:tetratricopeptide (TPR) repeat protein